MPNGDASDATSDGKPVQLLPANKGVAISRDVARATVIAHLVRDDRVTTLFARLRAERRDQNLMVPWASVTEWVADERQMNADLEVLREPEERARGVTFAGIDAVLEEMRLPFAWLPPAMHEAFGVWLVEADGRDRNAGATEGDLVSVISEVYFLLGLLVRIGRGALDGSGAAPTTDPGVAIPRTLRRSLYDRLLGIAANLQTFDAATEEENLAAMERALATTTPQDDWAASLLRIRRQDAGEPVVVRELTPLTLWLVPGSTGLHAHAEIDRFAKLAHTTVDFLAHDVLPAGRRPKSLQKAIERDVEIWWRNKVLGGPEHSISKMAVKFFEDPDRRHDVRRALKRAQTLIAMGDSG